MNIANLSPPTESICLETQEGRSISNDQSGDVQGHVQMQFRDLERKYGAHTKRKTEPNALYNCHGLTFASGRTGIYENKDIKKIISDDEYEEVTEDNCLPGDVVLYYGEDGDIEHSGIVVKSSTDDRLDRPIILSKWGHYSEVVHSANQCPYNYANTKYYQQHI